ncbi:hypothetical protein, partial [Micromonospora sp. NPDC057140]
VGAVLAAGLAGPARRRRWTAAGIAVLLACAGTAALVVSRPAATTTVSRDPCLVGVWRLTAGRYHLPVPADSLLGGLAGLTHDSTVDLTSGPEGGFATAYRADGTATDLYDLSAAQGTLDGHTVWYVHRGVVTYRWSASDGRYRQYDQVTAGDEVVLRVDDREVGTTTVAEESTGTYRCADDRLTVRLESDGGAWSEETFVRSPA